MSKTLRRVHVPEAEGAGHVVKRPEVDSRWRTERELRLRREERDAKRLERAERRSERAAEATPAWMQSVA